MKAEYTSKCAYCGEKIHIDDDIELLDEEQEWVHEECAEDAKRYG